MIVFILSLVARYNTSYTLSEKDKKALDFAIAADVFMIAGMFNPLFLFVSFIFSIVSLCFFGNFEFTTRDPILQSVYVLLILEMIFVVGVIVVGIMFIDYVPEKKPNRGQLQSAQQRSVSNILNASAGGYKLPIVPLKTQL